MRTPRIMTALAAIALAWACGGHASHSKPTGPRVTTKLDPVKPSAARAFEAAMRAIRLGGPEAADTAKARLQDALKEDASIWEAWHDLGVIAYNDGDDDAAIDDFTKALAINKSNTPTLLARAEANRRAGHKKDARADYEAALRGADEADPSRRDAAARLAALLRDDGSFDDAVDVLRETVRTAGVNAKIYTELGLIYIAQKRLELAHYSMLAKAVELDAKDPAVYNALAVLALREGKAQDAFDRFDQAVSLRRKLPRRAFQQGRRPPRRRRLCASQGRAVGDRRKEARRLRRAGRARRRGARAQRLPGGKIHMGSSSERCAAAAARFAPTRCSIS